MPLFLPEGAHTASFLLICSHQSAVTIKQTGRQSGLVYSQLNSFCWAFSRHCSMQPHVLEHIAGVTACSHWVQTWPEHVDEVKTRVCLNQTTTYHSTASKNRSVYSCKACRHRDTEVIQIGVMTHTFSVSSQYSYVHQKKKKEVDVFLVNHLISKHPANLCKKKKERKKAMIVNLLATNIYRHSSRDVGKVWRAFPCALLTIRHVPSMNHTFFFQLKLIVSILLDVIKQSSCSKLALHVKWYIQDVRERFYICEPFIVRHLTCNYGWISALQCWFAVLDIIKSCHAK